MGKTNHLSDRELYERLVTDVLAEEDKDLSGIPGMLCEVEVLGESDRDIALWLKYYVDDETRADWARDFPDFEVPAPEPLPYDRDKRFQRPLF